MMMSGAQENVDKIMTQLEKMISTKTVIGEPQQIGDITLIPVVDVLFGFGGGLGEGNGPESKGAGTGSGGGGGAKLSPRAVLVIQDGKVSVQLLTKGGAMEKIVESLPTILKSVSVKMNKKETEEPAAE